MTKHLSLWRERTNDFTMATSEILEMENQCHQRLKQILLRFLPKRHNLFVNVRDLLDPTVDALETSAVLAEMNRYDQRLVQAVMQFQPEKKRSILSLVSSSTPSSDKAPRAPSLDDFSSLAAVDTEVLKKSENVHDYSIVKWKMDKHWVPALAVVTRQHFMHIYMLPKDIPVTFEETFSEQQETAVRTALESSSPIQSIALLSSTLDQSKKTVTISYQQDATDEDKSTEDINVQLKFASAPEALQWLSATQNILVPTEPEGESNQESSTVVRV